MASMRAQLSLQFSDEDLFYNFVKPYKDKRLLNNVILKCLSSYYYDEEARNRIEGTFSQGVEEETVKSQSELFDEIRQAIVVQDFMVKEGQAILENGIEDTQNILNNINKRAEDMGVAKTTVDESGTEMLRVNKGISEKSDENSSRKQSIKVLDTEGKLNILIQAVEILAEASGNIEVRELLTEPVKTESDDESETVSQTGESDSSLGSSDMNENISYEVEEDIPAAVNEEPVSESEDEFSSDDFAPDESVVEAPVEDATDSANDLLASLFG